MPYEIQNEWIKEYLEARGIRIDPRLDDKAVVADVRRQLDTIPHQVILGVAPGISSRELKTRYWYLMKRFHPDAIKTDQELLRLIGMRINTAHDAAKNGQAFQSPYRYANPGRQTYRIASKNSNKRKDLAGQASIAIAIVLLISSAVSVISGPAGASLSVVYHDALGGYLFKPLTVLVTCDRKVQLVKGVWTTTQKETLFPLECNASKVSIVCDRPAGPPTIESAIMEQNVTYRLTTSDRACKATFVSRQTG